MRPRGGDVALTMLAHVQQATMAPFINATSTVGACLFTEEYDSYARLQAWGSTHKTVCHRTGESARDDEGDGFHEVHVKTIEGGWSLWRSWIRPPRGISQENLPLSLGFFEFVHHAKKRGKALLGSLLELLLA